MTDQLSGQLTNQLSAQMIVPFDPIRFFLGNEPPLYLLEIVVRVVLIYGFAIFALRFMGKRGKREMSPFEYLVIVALGSATGDAMFYPEVPILYAWLVILTVIAMNRAAAGLQLRSKKVNVFLEGVPRLLVQHGEVLETCAREENLRVDELMQLLRAQGVTNTGEIRYAFLEPTGDISLLRAEPGANYQGRSTLPESFEADESG